MYQNDAQKCLLQNVRLSYVNLLEPRAPQNGNGDPKYSVTLLIPKSDQATLTDIQSAMQAAATAGKDAKWGGVMPPQPKIPLHDGDGVRQSGEPYGPECKGMWVLTASSKLKPEVVDSTCKPIMDATAIYSGMWGHVTVRFFAYANSGNKGIGCGLGNVMKTKDDEALGGGRASADEDFAGLAQQPQPAANPGVMPWTVQPQQQPTQAAAPSWM